MTENQLIKYINSELNSQEKSDVDLWVAESKNNQLIFNQIKELWSIAEEPIPYDIPNIEEAWNKLQPTLTTEKSSSKKWFTIAATILIAITGFFINDMTKPFKELVVDRAETRIINLVDNSKISVNSESKLTYFNTTNDSVRKVFLEGEAYFEVAKTGKPFIVETPNAIIRVLGTKFNIRSRDGETVVYVTEGKVSVRPLRKRSRRIILTKGFKTEIKQTNIPVKMLFKHEKMAWLERKIVFDQVKISDICDELERLYDVKIDIRGKANRDMTLTATFERNFLVQNILKSMCTTLNLKLGKRDGVYVVFK
jgi:transmembrane sensor